MSRVIEEIAKHGARVEEIDIHLKLEDDVIKAATEKKQALLLAREKEVFAIQALENVLDENEKEKTWTAWNRNKRPGDPLSMPVLLEKVLDGKPQGLPIPMLLLELKKIGFQSKSKDPHATLASVLHRCKPQKFLRKADGRWFLSKYQTNVVPILKEQS